MRPGLIRKVIPNSKSLQKSFFKMRCLRLLPTIGLKVRCWRITTLPYPISWTLARSCFYRSRLLKNSVYAKIVEYVLQQDKSMEAGLIFSGATAALNRELRRRT